MLIAILGVLKSGGAYVPMDPSYPDDRIGFILNDTKAKVLITNSKVVGKIQESLRTLHGKVWQSTQDNRFYLRHAQAGMNACNDIVIDNNEFQQVSKKQLVSNPKPNISSSNLAYVIYTSGTTGKPKGVMIEHNSILNTIYSIKDLYHVRENCKVSFFTSYVFDVSVSEIFTTLISGNELHIFSESVRRDAEAISDYLLSNKINVCYLPPVLLASIKKQHYPDLINLIYAGEPCDYETGKYWSLHKKLYNYYGPTETSVYCLGKQVINGDIDYSYIGKPIQNK